MPTAYVLAKDKIEQAKAIVSGEVWHDAELAGLLDHAVQRLAHLDQQIMRDVKCWHRDPDQNRPATQTRTSRQ